MDTTLDACEILQTVVQLGGFAWADLRLPSKNSIALNRRSVDSSLQGFEHQQLGGQCPGGVAGDEPPCGNDLIKRAIGGNFRTVPARTKTIDKIDLDEAIYSNCCILRLVCFVKSSRVKCIREDSNEDNAIVV